MAKREVFHSVYDRKAEDWKVTKGGTGGAALSAHETQKKAEASAIKNAKAVEKAGGTSQVVLHKKDNRIREDRSYGAERRRARPRAA